MSVISAQEFIKRATREILIPGFNDEEEYYIRIKPMSLLGMIRGGKIDNELLVTVFSLFKSNKVNGGANTEINEDDIPIDMLSNPKMIQDLDSLMRQVAKEVMVEPRYEEIADYLTDAQLQTIFTKAQGKINKLKPSDEE